MKRYILILIVLAFSVNSNAQKGYTEFSFPASQPSLPGVYPSGVAFDDSGNVWMSFGRRYPVGAIGGGGGGVARWDGTNIQIIRNDNSPLVTDPVTAIAYAKGFLWMGTPAGLFRYNRKGNAAANWKLYDSLGGLGDTIVCLKVIGDNLWIGSKDGFGVLNLNTGDFTHFDGSLWGKSKSITVSDIAAGDNGEIWVATNDGLVHKNGTTYTVFDTLNSGLKKNVINTVCWKKSASELWIGTAGTGMPGIVEYSGLYRLKNNTIKRIEEISDCNEKAKNNLEMVFQVIEEKQSGDILVVSSTSFTPNKPAFMRIRDNQVSKYYIKARVSPFSAEELVGPAGTGLPLLLAYNNNNHLWLGTWGQKYFVIDDLSLLTNNRENAGKLAEFTSSASLSVNQVDALVHNNGDMFWDLMSESRYEVPKNSCKSPIFASALWMGGKDPSNNLHLAAMTYRQGGLDYFPGPLDTITAKGDSASAYDKIWRINRWDIEQLKKKHADGSLANGSYTPPADFITWPAHGTGKYSYNMAPFADIDNNGKYEPLKGDYPAIKGEQALYWIFNDNVTIHTETQGLPLGVEVHAMAYAYNCDTIKPGSPNEALNYTTFYEYKIINRSTEKYDSTYFGVWTDVDLGNNYDDKIGCNIPGNFGFVYNGDNNDEGAMGYGTNPPMLSIVLLSDTMTNFTTNNADFSVGGFPTLSEHYYNYMRSVWKDGSPLTYGGNGYHTGAPVKHLYSGTPYSNTGWLDSSGGDRRFLQSAGPYDFEPGGVKTFSYAIVYSREPNQPNGLNTSWAKNMSDVNAIKNWHTSQSFPTCLTHRPGLGVESPAIQNGEVKLVPNPFSGNTSLVFNLNNEEDINLEVYNMLGQVVYSRNAQMLPGTNAVEIELASQPAGVYMYLLKAGNAMYSGRMINVSR